jgi:hypothetical protein
MRRKTRKAAGYIARRTERVTAQGLGPGEEARRLLRLLAKADDRGFCRDHEPWPGDVEEVFGPAIDRLLDLGPDVVDPVLCLEPRADSFQADVAASLLARLVREGQAGDRIADMIAWGLQRWDRQAEGFTESLEEVVSRAGPAAEAPLVRHLGDRSDGHAIAIVSFALQDADPAWAGAAAARLTREALEAGDVEVASVLSYAAATACGEDAAPLVRDVLGRMREEGVGRDAWLPCAFEASLLLGVHPGPAWAKEVESFLDGMTVGEFAAGYEEEDLLATARTDPSFLPRHELARACRLMGLEDGGSKPELVDRLEEAYGMLEVADAGRLSPPPLEGLTTARLRELCSALRLDPGGPREDLLERLGAFKDEVDAGSGLELTRAELEAMDVADLREVCRGMGLETAGKRRALVARIQMAQEAGDRG